MTTDTQTTSPNQPDNVVPFPAQDDDGYLDPRPVKGNAELGKLLDSILAVLGEDDGQEYGDLPFQIGPDADRALRDRAERAQRVLSFLTSDIEAANDYRIFNELMAERRAEEHARRSAGAKRAAQTRKRNRA